MKNNVKEINRNVRLETLSSLKKGRDGVVLLVRDGTNLFGEALWKRVRLNKRDASVLKMALTEVSRGT